MSLKLLFSCFVNIQMLHKYGLRLIICIQVKLSFKIISLITSMEVMTRNVCVNAIGIWFYLIF